MIAMQTVEIAVQDSSDGSRTRYGGIQLRACDVRDRSCCFCVTESGLSTWRTPQEAILGDQEVESSVEPTRLQLQTPWKFEKPRQK